MDVAAVAFEELGYAGTTTNKVAEAAGISIGTLYHYFPDKDALLYSLAERHLAGARESMMAVFAGLREQQPGLEESLRAGIEMNVRLHVNEPQLHRLLYDRAPRSEALHKRLQAVNAAIGREVAWHFKRLGVAHRHRALMANMVVAGIESQVHSGLIDARKPVDPELLIEMLTQLWLRALEGS
ncbi:TetR/AcrR family transcriptional regulator [Mycolicibacterium mengxianglii]|uniref:TetR/AcrR family transcriptional regulator n=1 Tax=Mycolicibacterium mengxianglii TaxID=2736649 RepID=UPI0018EEEFE8|nr:TetR/AcrR family transcriptional regulator [Mycolicibacterium mengxianglii]